MGKTPTSQLEAARRWKAKNPQKVVAARVRLRAADPKKQQDRSREWRKANPQTVRVHSANYRARKISAGSHTEQDIQWLLEKQRGKCACCSKRLRKYHVDHIQPLLLGGSNERWNLQLLCVTCNLSKGSKAPAEFAKRIGKLL